MERRRAVAPGLVGAVPVPRTVLGAVLGTMLGLVLAASPASAQVPAGAAEVERLAWLVGEWEGEGWIELAPGRRAEFQGTEAVERRMGGRLVVVEGEYTAVMGPPGTPPTPVHQAFGVFSHDAGDGFSFRTYTARGGNGEAHAATVKDGEVVWGYEDPRMGRVRYTITRTEAGSWREVGHVSPDGGATWHQFFAMELRRVSPRTGS